MKRILSIVFLVIPLLFLTTACGEETQAKVPPAVQQVVPIEVKKAAAVVEQEVVAEPEEIKSAVAKVGQEVVAEPEEIKSAVEKVEQEVVAEPEETNSAVETPAETVAMDIAFKPEDHKKGAKLFQQNCAACHVGGGNLVAANKTLKKDALEKYNMYSQEAIVYQITNGKNAMPAFKGRLSTEQIEQLAGYVIAQADKGW